MVSVELPFHQLANVWLDELPDVAYPSVSVMEKSFASAERTSVLARVAVEWFAPKGGRAWYGLLGAEFVPKSGSSLALKIHVSNEDGMTFASGLTGATEVVRIGLSLEYAQGVLRGVVESMASGIGLPSGELVFHHGAYGEIGSCQEHFRRLAHVVVRLIAQGKGISAQEGLVETFRMDG